VLRDLPVGATARCLDAGCGEGYYLRQLATAVGDSPASLAILGLDISKWAVQAAAKQDQRLNWVVGSNAHLPALPGSIDRLLCLFGFPVYGEFARVLKPGGVLLQVDAGPDHLRELRQVIYPMLKPERPSAQQIPDDFIELDLETVGYVLEITGSEAIADLLAMTPHFHRTTDEGRARAAGLAQMAITVDVRLRRWERQPAR
jgi:23S rRNA (guanine745-N1)-methyltransferase